MRALVATNVLWPAIGLWLASGLGACSHRPVKGSDAVVHDAVHAEDTGRSDNLSPRRDGPLPGPCTRGRATPVGRLCVRGRVSRDGKNEDLLPDEPVRFQIFPKGCFSSSCTEIVEARCAVTSASGSPDGTVTFSLESLFCLEDTSGPGIGCSADCGGGGQAECSQLTGVGLFVARIDELKLNFAVPITITGLGGHCVGDPF